MMTVNTRSTRLLALAAAIALAPLVGCTGSPGGSILYDASYTLGTIINGLVIEPAMMPTVKIEVTVTNTANGVVLLKAIATGIDLPLKYHWDQIEGDAAVIASPEESTTEVLLPVDAAGAFGFEVKVTDAQGRQASDAVQLNLHLGS
ncbi:MAG: hypothetical protein JXQ73_20600 [Phycisphaerae bacterium]|nr:hypothetical protein [Phycisphaerae bacterium]